MAKQIDGLSTKILGGLAIFVIASACGGWVSHVMSVGHPVLVERVGELQRDVTEIKADVKSILRNGHGAD